MRLRIPLAVTAVALTAVALTSAVTGGSPFAAEPVRAGSAPREPTCAARHPAVFPISTRIHGGPATYHPGGGSRTWSLDLTNETDAECADIHPVLVLIDEKRTLATRQIQLEFSDGKRRHPVRFERTDRGENIGVFDDGFPGFRVGPGRTLTVQARLTFTSDARPNSVVANAAVVQRRDDDGDWVGESGDYRFTLTNGKDKGKSKSKEKGKGKGRDEGGEQSGRRPGEQRDEPDAGLREPGHDSGTASGRTPDGTGPTTDTGSTPTTDTGSTPDSDTGSTPDTDTRTDTGAGKEPDTAPDSDTDTDTAPGTGAGEEPAPDTDVSPFSPDELALTGSRSLRGLGLASGALLFLGAALVAGSRRLRTDRR
ncbi:hypothetical protein ACIPWY_10850 [Streptomyces sp. NPDC090032]|uniref:hypothetical protein n=1 Tax=Streptomyces sp. NPDC090032 TaxID=3365925 RepID=UPI003801B474